MALVPRLVALGLPPWRHPRKLLAAYVAVITGILHAPRWNAAFLIAEDGHARPLGFVLLTAATDCYTRDRHAQLSPVVVTDGGRELAIGIALIAAATAWARSSGYRLLTLSEFLGNHPARALCRQPPTSRTS